MAPSISLAPDKMRAKESSSPFASQSITSGIFDFGSGNSREKACELTTARLNQVAMPSSSTRGSVTEIVVSASCWRARSFGPLPRTGVIVYLKVLPRSESLMPESHQRNFCNGATLLGRGCEFGPGGLKPILLRRKPSFSPGLNPGLRRIANPRKSENRLPAGQFIASKTRVGEV